MKRSLLASLLAFLLILVGCGGSDTTEAGDDTSPTSSSDDEGTSDDTDSADSSDTADGTDSNDTADGTDSADAADPTPEEEEGPSEGVQRALAVAGTYAGDWNNTTFGSTGPIEMEFSVDAEAAFALVTLDLGGNVFGAADPAPVVFEIDLATEEWLGGGQELLGETELTVDADGGWQLHSPQVPGLGLEMTMTATPTDSGFEGTYEIVTLAEGTFTLART
jgi:hypothetical protein